MRALARLAPAAAVILVVGCTTERSPAGVEPAPPLATAAADAPAAGAAQLAPAIIGPVNIAADERADGTDYIDPDAGGGAGVDDKVCDDRPGLAVGTICSFRAAVQNHNARPGEAHVITFAVDSVRLSGDAFAIMGGTVTIDGRRAPRGRLVIQGPWAATSARMAALQLSVCNSTVAGLAIVGFAGGGLQFIASANCGGAGANIVEDNYVGLNRLGRPYVGAGLDLESIGISVGSPDNAVRGNVVGGQYIGIAIGGENADGNQVVGNILGLAADSITPAPNGSGVVARQGMPPARPVRRALIQGNTVVAKVGQHAVSLSNADSSRIEDNRIGMDVRGRVHPNKAGIVVGSYLGAQQRHAVLRNQIAGSVDDGISIAASADNDVSGNVVTGAGRSGILVTGLRTTVTSNRVERSGGDGILLTTTATPGGFTVRGNTVLASGGAGIHAAGAQGIVVADNPRIEGNLRGGIVLGATSTVSGNTVVGNTGAGVLLRGARNVIVANTIAGNTGAGVAVDLASATGNTIRRNAISGNGAPTALGIDLGTVGVTPNDAGDADAGANTLQNFPVLSSATSSTVVGTLASTPGRVFKLDFYQNVTCDASGHGEAQTYLDSATVTTGATGGGSFTAVLARAATVGAHVTATATDPAGNTSELSACRLVGSDDDPAKNDPPVAVIANGPYAGVEGTPVPFSSAGSRDPEGGPLTFAWTSGDGGSSTLPNPQRLYRVSGKHTVSLVVRDSGGLADTATTEATIANVAPTVDLRAPTGTPTPGATLTFPHVVSDPGGSTDAPWTVVIDWGDEKTDSLKTSSLLGGPTCPSFCKTHVYAAAGTYTATMTVRDKDGGTGTDAVTVVVAVPSNRPPVANAGGPYTGTEGAAVAFRSTGSSDPEDGALTYLWTFGDGTTSTLANPSRAYGNNGSYAVTLVVTDPAGATGTATTTATITNAAPVVTLRVVGAATVMAGTTVTTEGSFTDPGTGDGPWQYFLRWSDGGGGGATYPPGTAISSGRKFDNPGTYTGTMQVTDRDGATGVSNTVTVTVIANPWVEWEGLGGSVADAPVVFSPSTGRFNVFARSADGVLWHRSFDGSTWGAWQSLGAVASNPAVASWTPGQFDIFVRGTDNTLWHRAYVSGAWGAWESLGGAMQGTPAAVSWGPGRLDIFVRGTDDALYHLGWQIGYGWSGWEPQGGGMSADPVVVSWGVGRLDVFVRGTDNALWYKFFQNGWSGWIGLGGALAGAPAAASWGPGRLDVFIRGAADNALWHLGWQTGYGWSAWEPQGGALTSEPAVVASGVGRLDVFARGTDNALYHKYFAGSWSGWVSRGGSLASSPAVTSRGVGWADVFVRGTDGAVWHRLTTP